MTIFDFRGPLNKKVKNHWPVADPIKLFFFIFRFLLFSLSCYRLQVEKSH